MIKNQKWCSITFFKLFLRLGESCSETSTSSTHSPGGWYWQQLDIGDCIAAFPYSLPLKRAETGASQAERSGLTSLRTTAFCKPSLSASALQLQYGENNTTTIESKNYIKIIHMKNTLYA